MNADYYVGAATHFMIVDLATAARNIRDKVRTISPPFAPIHASDCPCGEIAYNVLSALSHGRYAR